ncbi:MAG: FecR family protein [Candidatus Gracilibacteria bacterium]|nr:FecR family protein [Candidatus Gracilibacteria bacterium]
MNNKKGFSIIEIIITISIIVLLAVIGISSKRGYDENVSNTKVVADTKTINNALEQYIQENKTLPTPGGNINYFKIDTSYAHAYEDVGTFGVYGSLTEETLPKQYLDILPLDPRTNSYYSYGKTKNTNEFEVASIQMIDGVVVSKVIGNYTAENGPYNLIREYNGPNFVYNGSETNFPYNPDELIMIATDKDKNVYREGDTITVAAGQELEIFFSDGSVSVLGEPTSQTVLTLNKLNFKGKDNLNTLVQLGLEAGQIWTKATKLNDKSEFEVYTSDSSAAVRGTIFGVIKIGNNTDVIVIEGELAILETATINQDETIDATVSLEETVIVTSGTTGIDEGTEIKKYKGIKIIDRLIVDINDYPKMKRLYKDDNNQLVAKTTVVATSDYYNSTESTIKIGENIFKIPKYSVDPKTQTEEYKKRIEIFNETLLNPINDISINPDYSDLTPDPEEERVDAVRCKSFNINDVCQDDIADAGLTASGYILYAYAPYDVAGDINLYGTGSNTTNGKFGISSSSILNNGVNLPDQCLYTGDNKSNSFCYINDNTKGVFIDNINSTNDTKINDFIKYSGLDLGDDFAIEMNLQNVWKTQTGNKYVFDNNSNGLMIGNSINGIINNIYYGGVNICTTDCNLNLNTFGDFINITVINGEKIKITDGTNNKEYNLSSSISNSTYLYIGGKSNKTLQINGVIDYVKILKK